MDRINFINIYTLEAHPIGSASPYSDKEIPSVNSFDTNRKPVNQPSTYQERVAMAAKTATEQGIKIPILVDEIDNPVWCTYGPAPNIAYLIGIDGKIITKQGWYQPDLMEQAIIKYLNIKN